MDGESSSKHSVEYPSLPPDVDLATPGNVAEQAVHIASGPLGPPGVGVDAAAATDQVQVLSPELSPKSCPIRR